MKKLILGILVVFGAWAAAVSADIIRQGLEVSSSGPSTSLNLELGVSAGDLITLKVSAERADKMKGFGFVLAFDPEQFAYVGSEEAEGSIISPGSNQALLVHKNHEDGRVAVGAVQVDGSAATGAGELVEVTFRRIGNGEVVGPGFQLTEGVVVDLSGQTRSVEPSVLDRIVQGPTDYELGQNVPNPFNPETTISYQLPAAGHVRMTVYTSLGQEVRTLIDDIQEVGDYTVRWDGRDSVGRQVASGVYFYRMRAGDFADTKRMLLLK